MPTSQIAPDNRERVLSHHGSAADGRAGSFDKARNVPLGSPRNRRSGRSGDLRHATADRHLGARRTAGQTPRLAAGGRSMSSGGGPVFASLTIPGKIGGHAITGEVRLWRGSPRIEFGVDLNTPQPDNGIFCIRFPIGMTRASRGRHPLWRRIARQSREGTVPRRELLPPASPKATTPRDGPTSVARSSATRLSARPACSPAMLSRRANSRSSSSWTAFQPMPKDVFVRARHR